MLKRVHLENFKALKGVDLDALTLEQIIKEALKKMMKG